MSKAPHIIGIPPGKRELWIERHPETYEYATESTRWYNGDGYWLLPLSTNRDRTLGEFLKLYDNGKIERVTIRPDDDNAVVLIKPEDR